jgi:hypothetical protein
MRKNSGIEVNFMLTNFLDIVLIFEVMIKKIVCLINEYMHRHRYMCTWFKIHAMDSCMCTPVWCKVQYWLCMYGHVKCKMLCLCGYFSQYLKIYILAVFFA